MTSKLVVYNFTMNIFKRTVKKVSLLLFLCFIVIGWFCNLVKQVITRIVFVNIIIVWDRNWDRIEYVNKWRVVKNWCSFQIIIRTLFYYLWSNSSQQRKCKELTNPHTFIGMWWTSALCLLLPNVDWMYRISKYLLNISSILFEKYFQNIHSILHNFN